MSNLNARAEHFTKEDKLTDHTDNDDEFKEVRGSKTSLLDNIVN